jgi:predicted MPP superfamily phosphohydrolase
MFHIAPALFAAVVIWRFVPHLPIGRLWKIAIGLTILLISQWGLITNLFGGWASPEVPKGVIILAGWATGSFILLLCFLILKDIASLTLWLGNKTGILSPNLKLGWKWSVSLCALAVILSAIGTWQGIKVPDVRQTQIYVRHLPKELDGLRIVQLTDLHACRLLDAEWTRAVVDKANALKPDLIVVTGDLVDGLTKNRVDDVAPYKDLTARLGVFVAAGNHEYYSNYLAWMRYFNAMGLRILSNEHVILEDKGHRIVLAGTTDRVAARFGLPEPDIEKALSGKPEGAPVILLAHQPKGAEANAAAGADLQLSGHTHGGQVLGIHWLNQYVNGGYVSGLYDVAGMKLYVSNGTGLWNGFPLRLGKPSEITELILHPEAP